MMSITTMLELLKMVDASGSNPRYRGPNTRGEMSKHIKDRHGGRAYDLWQEAWRKGYIRRGRVWGFVLTNKGMDEQVRLRGF